MPEPTPARSTALNIALVVLWVPILGFPLVGGLIVGIKECGEAMKPDPPTLTYSGPTYSPGPADADSTSDVVVVTEDVPIDAGLSLSQRVRLARAALKDRDTGTARTLLEQIPKDDQKLSEVRSVIVELFRQEDAEAEAARRLECNDGTTSPTCMCHGPHGGCCSHHGGVRGCESLNHEPLDQEE